MKKIYYLSTCDTCKKIMKQIPNIESFDCQDIKKNPISEEQLDALKEKVGSYEALFNKRAQRYKQENLKDKNLTEADFKKYLLEHYTFLARPVVLLDDQCFVGNSKKTQEALFAATKSI